VALFIERAAAGLNPEPPARFLGHGGLAYGCTQNGRVSSAAVARIIAFNQLGDRTACLGMGGCGGETLVQIGDDVVRIFDSHREPD